MTIFEIARFTLVPGTKPAAAYAAWLGSQAWAKSQPGFVNRRLIADDKGDYIDLVEWADMASAKAAQAAFDPADQNLAPFVAVIDMTTLVMGHYHPLG